MALATVCAGGDREGHRGPEGLGAGAGTGRAPHPGPRGRGGPFHQRAVGAFGAACGRLDRRAAAFFCPCRRTLSKEPQGRHGDPGQGRTGLPWRPDRRPRLDDHVDQRLRGVDGRLGDQNSSKSGSLTAFRSLICAIAVDFPATEGDGLREFGAWVLVDAFALIGPAASCLRVSAPPSRSTLK